jgi:hypothetical protein
MPRRMRRKKAGKSTGSTATTSSYSWVLRKSLQHWSRSPPACSGRSGSPNGSHGLGASLKRQKLGVSPSIDHPIRNRKARRRRWVIGSNRTWKGRTTWHDNGHGEATCDSKRIKRNERNGVVGGSRPNTSDAMTTPRPSVAVIRTSCGLGHEGQAPGAGRFFGG